MNPSIWDMLTSRKAVVMLVSIACVTVLAALGKVSGSEALEFSKWVVMVWIGAQAVVDATSFQAVPHSVANSLLSRKQLESKKGATDGTD